LVSAAESARGRICEGHHAGLVVVPAWFPYRLCDLTQPQQGALAVNVSEPIWLPHGAEANGGSEAMALGALEAAEADLAVASQRNPPGRTDCQPKKTRWYRLFLPGTATWGRNLSVVSSACRASRREVLPPGCSARGNG